MCNLARKAPWEGIREFLQNFRYDQLSELSENPFQDSLISLLLSFSTKHSFRHINISMCAWFVSLFVWKRLSMFQAHIYIYIHICKAASHCRLLIVNRYGILEWNIQPVYENDKCTIPESTGRSMCLMIWDNWLLQYENPIRKSIKSSENLAVNCIFLSLFHKYMIELKTHR